MQAEIGAELIRRFEDPGIDTAQQGDRPPVVDLVEKAQLLDPVGPAKQKVEDHEIGQSPGNSTLEIGPILGAVDRPPGANGNARDNSTDCRFVVEDDEMHWPPRHRSALTAELWSPAAYLKFPNDRHLFDMPAQTNRELPEPLVPNRSRSSVPPTATGSSTQPTRWPDMTMRTR